MLNRCHTVLALPTRDVRKISLLPLLASKNGGVGANHTNRSSRGFSRRLASYCSAPPGKRDRCPLRRVHRNCAKNVSTRAHQTFLAFPATCRINKLRFSRGYKVQVPLRAPDLRGLYAAPDRIGEPDTSVSATLPNVTLQLFAHIPHTGPQDWPNHGVIVGDH